MTDNHNYNTPDKGSTDWHIPLNDNFKRLDTGVEIRDEEANIENYSPKSGAKFLAVDTGVRYIGDGSSWKELVIPSKIVERFKELEARIETLEEKGNEDDTEDGNSGSDADVVVPFDSSDQIQSTRDTCEIVTDPDGGNRNVLKVGWNEAGDLYGSSFSYYAEDYVNNEPQNAHARFWIYHPPEFEFYTNGPGGTKLPGFAHTDDAGWGHREPGVDGNGWSARGGIARPNHGWYNETSGPGWYNQVYHYDQDGDESDHLVGSELDPGFGQWHQIDQYVEMNTPGQNDGIYKVWIDGKMVSDNLLDPFDSSKVSNYDEIQFRDVDADYLHVHRFWFNCYFGGSYGAQRDDEALYFKNLKIWFDQGEQL
ncbi:polysaccharide lyase [Halomontanus rarus]|uniref:polysaccharide lyase n=1 Tax=Halomontanus rarus TaxID=3034020 RepID=UPI0023E819BA|nr:hypothetical protein [Halovivax sp. TS33]